MPYIVGHPIKNPDDFYGRSQQVSRFFEIVAGTQTQSVSVLGLRRSGKTSFLQYVLHEEVLARHVPNPGDYAMIYLDMSSYKTPADFYRRLLVRLRNLLGEGQRVNLWRASPAGQTNMYDVESLLCQFPEKRVVLLLDEFDQLRTDAFGQDFLIELRALISVLDYDLACVTASYWDMYHLGNRVGLPPTSPFYNIFYPTPVYLSGLQTAEAHSLIRTPAQHAGLSFSDEEVTTIRQLAGSLPFFLQATAAKWFHLKRAGQSSRVETLLPRLAADLSPYFVQWWRHFSAGEQALLRAVAGQTAVAQLPYSPIERREISRRLCSYGLLLEEGDTLQVNGGILTTWLNTYAGDAEKNGHNTTGPLKEIVDPVVLRHALIDYFDMEELRTLCFDLGVDFDALPGKGKGGKARDLIIYWQRRDELHRLVEAVRYERGTVI